jgi:4'-phosphopantetheinyl transferase
VFDNRRGFGEQEFASLGSDERVHAGRLATERDRNAFVITRAKLRLRLGESLGLAPGDIRFERNSWGKLSLAGGAGERLDFSVSHTTGLSAIALSDGYPIGIDLERQRNFPDRLRITADAFGEEVAQQLRRVPPGQQNVVFLQLWTAGEAFVKAQGLGFAGLGGKVPLHLIMGESPQVRLRDDLSDNWTFHPLLLPSGFVGNVTASRRPRPMDCPTRI